MTDPITPSRLAEGIGISVSFASQILSGRRKPSNGHALAAFRTFGLRLGFLAELSDADISALYDDQMKAVERAA